MSREVEGAVQLGKSKALILVVDIDDDIADAGITTPVIGYESVLDAAIRFAIAKPEDSDVNTIFAGLNLYRSLVDEGEDVEIAIVSGHKENLLEAQRRVREQVEEVISYIGANEGEVGFYVISDSEYDLLVLEVLRDLGRISGVKRVLVEQHLGIEASYMLIARYLKKAISDPRFTKYTLGIPGTLLLVGGLLSLLGYGSAVAKVLGILLGIAMIVRGFNLEPHIASMLRALYTQHGLVIMGYIVLGMFTLASIVATYYAFTTTNSLVEGLATTLRVSLPLFILGGVFYIVISKVLYKLMHSKLEVWGEAAAITMAIFTSLAFYKLGSSMESIMSSLEGNPQSILSLLLASGFIQLILIGVSIAALIELVHKART